jgi:hypothetical protein
MDSGSKYRDYAKQCLAMAATASNPDHKRVLNDLASTWRRLADELERSPYVEAYPTTGSSTEGEAGTA